MNFLQQILIYLTVTTSFVHGVWGCCVHHDHGVPNHVSGAHSDDGRDVHASHSHGTNLEISEIIDDSHEDHDEDSEHRHSPCNEGHCDQTYPRAIATSSLIIQLDWFTGMCSSLVDPAMTIASQQLSAYWNSQPNWFVPLHASLHARLQVWLI